MSTGQKTIGKVDTVNEKSSIEPEKEIEKLKKKVTNVQTAIKNDAKNVKQPITEEIISNKIR